MNKFKVGDRVEVVKSWHSDKPGMKGEIVVIKDDGRDDPYGVRFDGWTHGNNLQGFLNDSSGHWLPASHIKPHKLKTTLSLRDMADADICQDSMRWALKKYTKKTHKDVILKDLKKEHLVWVDDFLRIFDWTDKEAEIKKLRDRKKELIAERKEIDEKLKELRK